MVVLSPEQIKEIEKLRISSKGPAQDGAPGWNACLDRVLAIVGPAAAAPGSEVTEDNAERQAVVDNYAGRAVSALWPVFGGNHWEAEFWNALGSMFRTALMSDDPTAFIQSAADRVPGEVLGADELQDLRHDRYLLQEILGCYEEYKDMPCSSLRERLMSSIHVAEHHVNARPKKPDPTLSELEPG